MIFTVEVTEGGILENQEVEIYLDTDALKGLERQLGLLKSRGDHAHFFTESWGGSPLSDEVQKAGNHIINHMRITLV